MRLFLHNSALWLSRCVPLALLYFLVGRAGRAIDFAQEDARVLLPQSGVALTGLLVLGIRFWPGVLIGSLLTTRAAANPAPMDMALTFAAGNTLGAVAGTWMLRRWGGFDGGFRRLHDVYAFLLFGVILSPVLSVALTVGVFTLRESVEPLLAWTLAWRRWFGQGISNLILAPVLLVWARPRAARLRAPRVLEGLFLLSALMLVSQGVFMGRSAIRELTYPLSFAPFPLVIWAALRFGPRGAATATVTVAAFAIYGLSQGHGPFLRSAPDQPLIVAQIYLTALAVSALFLAAAIAERQTSEAALLETQNQLRALSARLERSREEERARISREVHDELGQVLTAIKMGLHGLLRKLPPEEAEGGSALQRKGRMLMELADNAVHAVRRIATELRPGILDDLGLQESVNWMVTEFGERLAIEARFENGVDGLVIDRERSTALFRIAQEALTNVARHARADRVDVSLTREENWLVLRVEDAGIGIDGARGRTDGLGLVGMRERAALLGGALRVEGREAGAKGTVVTARIPL